MVILSMGIRFIYKFRHNPYQVYRTFSIVFFNCFFFLILKSPKSYLNPTLILKILIRFSCIFILTEHSINCCHRVDLASLFWSGAIFGFLVITLYSPIILAKDGIVQWYVDVEDARKQQGTYCYPCSVKRIKPGNGNHTPFGFCDCYDNIGTGLRITRLVCLQSAIPFTLPWLVDRSRFSGIVGVGFIHYCARIWCRWYGCPMAAYLGILSKTFSRFRITTNHGQCIRLWQLQYLLRNGHRCKIYMLRGADINALPVGCGICSSLSMGSTRLENK